MKLNKNGSLPKAVRFQMYKEALEIIKEGKFTHPIFKDYNIDGLCVVFHYLIFIKMNWKEYTDNYRITKNKPYDAYDKLIKLFPEIEPYKPREYSLYWFRWGDLKPRIKIIEEILGGKNE